MTGKEAGGGNVCGVLGINVNVGHCRNYGREHNVPVLGGILVDAHFYALQYVDLCGEGKQGGLEGLGYGAALGLAARKLEHYYMLYHVLCGF